MCRVPGRARNRQILRALKRAPANVLREGRTEPDSKASELAAKSAPEADRIPRFPAKRGGLGCLGPSPPKGPSFPALPLTNSSFTACTAFVYCFVSVYRAKVSWNLAVYIGQDSGEAT